MIRSGVALNRGEPLNKNGGYPFDDEGINPDARHLNQNILNRNALDQPADGNKLNPVIKNTEQGTCTVCIISVDKGIEQS